MNGNRANRFTGVRLASRCWHQFATSASTALLRRLISGIQFAPRRARIAVHLSRSNQGNARCTRRKSKAARSSRMVVISCRASERIRDAGAPVSAARRRVDHDDTAAVASIRACSVTSGGSAVHAGPWTVRSSLSVGENLPQRRRRPVGGRGALERGFRQRRSSTTNDATLDAISDHARCRRWFLACFQTIVDDVPMHAPTRDLGARIRFCFAAFERPASTPQSTDYNDRSSGISRTFLTFTLNIFVYHTVRNAMYSNIRALLAIFLTVNRLVYWKSTQ